MSESKRQTGRTTRMLEEANRLAIEDHRAVYVVALNEGHQADLRERLRAMGAPGSVKVETPSSLRNLDWASLTLRGAHPNCVVLADHAVIESKFRALLDMLTRFDEGPSARGRELNEAFLAGWSASDEGFNGMYPREGMESLLRDEFEDWLRGRGA